MDPLSVAVNILTLITVAGKTAQGLERLIAVHDAPRELFAVLSEITALRLLLGTVETSLKSVQDSTNPSVLEACRNIAAIRSHLLTVFLALDDLVETKLRKQSAAWGIHRTQVAKVSWLRYASDMRRLLADLRAQTALLSTAMTALNVIQTGSLSSGGPTPSVTFTIQGLSIATSPPADNAEQVPLALQLEQMLKRLSLASPGNGGSPVPQRIEDGQETTAPEEEARGDDEEGEPSFVPTAPGTSGTDGRDETSHAEPSQVVALRATTSTSTCPRFCHCQCHVYTRVRTPKWAKDVFGSIILQSNTALTLARKPCNYLGCRRSGSVAAQFTYYAPAWVWMRAVHVTAARQSVFGLGASVSFSFPRRTPRARIWQLIFVGSVDGVREELETGRASIYDIDAEGESILHYAGRIVQPRICELLLQRGADMFYCNYKGVSAYATGFDHVLSNPVGHSNVPQDKVSLFASLYADEAVVDHLELTLLHRIVLGLSSADLATQLALSARDIDTPDSSGRTPIWWAARRGDAAKLNTLLAWGADAGKPDNELVTPLLKAVADGGDDCVEALLQAGVAVDAADDTGAQAIHNVFFASAPRPRTIELLVRYGADVNAPDSTGCTPLHWAVLVADETKLKAIVANATTLIAYGADVEMVSEAGCTPVMEAFYCPMRTLAEFFVGLGARLDGSTKRGRTVLHFAAWFCSIEWFKWMIELARQGRFADIDVYARHDGHDALDCLGKCRKEYYTGDRGDEKEELAVFKRLVDIIDGTIPSAAPEENDPPEVVLADSATL